MSTWVLLRGLTRDSRHWGAFLGEFRAQMTDVQTDAQTIALDFPGNGRWHSLNSLSTVQAMVEFCRDELRKQQVTPPFALLAISLGGMVAAEWAARYPDEVDGCVLINTSMRPYSSLSQRLRPRHYLTLLKLLILPLSDEQVETEVIRMTTNYPQSTKHCMEWTRFRREQPVSRLNALRQLMAAGRYRAPKRRPACPLLVIASSEDGMVDPQCSHQLAQAWHAPIVEHPTAGHDLTVDDGEWVARTVAKWWKESLHRS